MTSAIMNDDRRYSLTCVKSHEPSSFNLTAQSVSAVNSGGIRGGSGELCGGGALGCGDVGGGGGVGGGGDGGVGGGRSRATCSICESRSVKSWSKSGAVLLRAIQTCAKRRVMCAWLHGRSGAGSGGGRARAL